MLFRSHWGVDFYDLELDTTQTFNSPALITHTDSYINSSNNNNDTQEFIDDMYFGTVYYWRVRARNAVDTSAWSTVRFYLTRDDVLLNSPATNTLGFAGQTFNWDSHWGVDFYDLELDTTQTFNSPALITHTDSYINSSNNNNDTQEFIDDMFFGTTYYWRVRARNAVDTSGWSTVRIYLTRDDVALNTPANNTLGFTGNTFNWDSHWGVDFYDLQLDTTQSFNSPALVGHTDSYINSSNNNNDTQEFIDDLFFGTRYYWRVRARNAVDTTAWSTVRIYDTRDDVALNTPANNSLGFTGNTFNWDSHWGVDFYDLQLDTSQSFNSPVLVSHTDSYINSSNNNNDTQEFIDDLYFGTRYYWRVRARNAVDTSSWSSVRTYDTRNDVPLNSPANGTSNVNVSGTTLNWDSHWGVDRYELELDTVIGFNSGQLVQISNNYINSSNNNNDTRYVTGGLLATTIYYWRVRAINAVDTSIWTTWVFSTGVPIQVPSTPTLISPNNGAINTGTSVSLDWSDATNASNYEYQYDLTPSFSSPTTGTVTASNSPTLNLSLATVYYWRVRARNTNVIGNWSVTWSFDTGCNLPAPLVSGQSVCMGDEVTFTATGGPDYRWYDVATGGTPLVTGSSYNYGPALATDTIWVAAFSGTCEGPRSMIVLDVNPLPAVPVISQVGSDSLTASGGALVYQWFFNGNPLPQTGATIFANQTGTYTAVAVNQFGCVSDTSAGFPFVFISVEEELRDQVLVYPNPNQGEFTVRLPEGIAEWQIRLVNLQGKVVWEQSFATEGDLKVEAPSLPAGVYLLRYRNGTAAGSKAIRIE